MIVIKILIIEDDKGLNRGISFALAQENYKTITAENQTMRLELFRKEKPDAILLDLNFY